MEYFKDKSEYEEKRQQQTRALYLYIKEKYNQDRLPLLNYKDIKTILDYYKEIKKENDDLDSYENIDEIDVDNLCYDNEDEFSFSNNFSDSDEDN